MRCIPLCIYLVTFAVLPPSAWAQVTSDGTLNTTINTVGNNATITNGTAAGSNLFHSFGQFSIPTNGSATFDLVNTPNTSTIFSRVTGGTVSNINGLIRTTNSSNPVSLFLINPAGILFGPNASLNIGGSFVGTTANSIRFADGTELSAANPIAAPLLTVSAPIGLQMGQNPAAIQVQGVGHNLSSQAAIFAPYFPTGFPSGLRVQSGRTIALVGGDITLNGGVLTAPGGRIELGSAGAGQPVGIQTNAQGFSLSYGAGAMQSIQMTQRSLLDVSGSSAGSIQVQGDRIRLSEGSTLWSQNRGFLPAGDLTVRATGVLELIGTTPDERVSSGIVSETIGLGASGDLNISVRGLVMQRGGLIYSRSFTPAPSGNVAVSATDFIQMSGLAPATNLFNTLGSATTFTSNQAVPIATGQAGNVTVSTERLSMQDGSFISSTSFGDAPSGNLLINAGTVDLQGGAENTPGGDVPTGIISVSYLRGNSGKVTLNTRTLSLRDGGAVSTTNLGVGNSGSIVINASESIRASSQSFKFGQFSNISSTLGAVDSSRQFFGTDLVNGNAGDITITTPSLQLNQAGIGVGNYGVGSAGTINISAGLVRLSDRAGISAATASGEGGNIRVQAQNLWLLQNSQVTTTAGGAGNGGNITLNASVILGAGNSDIAANATQGRGGNIQITTQGIFGLKFRPQLTPDNDITASSQFGLNGTVAITDPAIDPTSGLVNLPLNLVDSSQQIATGCGSSQGSAFIATGRGGIPQNPTQEARSDRPWSDLRDPAAYRTRARTLSQAPASSGNAIAEASTLRRSDGQLELVATNIMPTQNQSATCAGAIATFP